MKHIGWCLLKLRDGFIDMPPTLDSEEKKKLAKKIVEDVQKYADTLIDLIHTPKFKERLQALEDSPIDEIKLRGNQVEELVKKFEHLLYLIDLNLIELREIIDEPNYGPDEEDRWKRMHGKIPYTIFEEYCDQMGDLSKEFNVTIHSEEDLKELVKSKKHLKELLK